MPSKKISQLTSKTNLNGNELIPVAYSGQTYAVPVSVIISSVTASTIGLNNVDNTSDLSKSISTLTQQALNNKSNTDHTHSEYAATSHEHSDYANVNHAHENYVESGHSHDISDVDGLTDALESKASTSPTTVEIVSVSDLTYSLTLSDAGKMIRFISLGAKTINISLTDTPVNTIFHITNRSPSGSGDLTLVFGGGIVGNLPKNGTFVLEPTDTVSIHFASAVSADIFGSTKAIQ